MPDEAASRTEDIIRAMERDFGLTPEVLVRIGAFISEWSAFDAGLEQVICFMNPHQAKKVATLQSGARIDLFEAEATALGLEWELFGGTTATVARAMLDFRNSIASGRPAERQQLAKAYFTPKRTGAADRPLFRENVLNVAVTTTHFLTDLVGDFIAIANEGGLEAIEQQFDRLNYVRQLQDTVFDAFKWLKMRGLR